MADDISPAQVRGARGMLDWSMIDLAKAAGVSVSTIKRAEDAGAAAVSSAKIGLIQSAFEAAGIRFLTDHRDGQGLVLRPQQILGFSRFMS